jgi:hypothetical protein
MTRIWSGESTGIGSRFWWNRNASMTIAILRTVEQNLLQCSVICGRLFNELEITEIVSKLWVVTQFFVIHKIPSLC